MGMDNFRGKGRPIVKYRDTVVVTCAKTAEPIVMPFGLWAQNCPRNRELDLDWVQIPHENGQFWMERVTHCKVCGLSAVSSADIAEPIDLQFGLWSRVVRRKHEFNHIRQVAPMCQHGRAHCRHLANTTEPSVCGGDAVLCQITSTTCFLCI